LVVTIPGLALAAKPKKKPVDDRPSVENPDGEDNIVGAVWELASVHPTTGEKRGFRFRADEGILYDGLGEVIGNTRLKKKNISVLTFNEMSPMPGVYTVKLRRVGHWSGAQNVDDVKWTLTLTCIDR